VAHYYFNERNQSTPGGRQDETRDERVCCPEKGREKDTMTPRSEKEAEECRPREEDDVSRDTSDRWGGNSENGSFATPALPFARLGE